MTTYSAIKTDWFVGLAAADGAAVGPLVQRGNPEPGRQRGVTRTLFVALGQNARTVTAAAARLSAHWMQTEPPLAQLDSTGWGAGSGKGAGTSEQNMQNATALHRLAAEELTAALQQRGYVIQRHDEIQLLLVADVTGDAAADTVSGATGKHSGAANPASEMLSLLRSMEAQVRQELRARTVPRVLLLARPADQASVAACVKTLQVGGVTDVWLAGPVTAEHQRLDDTAWLQRSARALAALAWTAFPSHACAAAGDGVRVLGVAGWDTALPAVRRWLALRSAEEALQLLHAETMAGADGAAASSPAAPSLLTENVEALAQSLAATTVPPLPPQAWTAATADWAQMAALVDGIAAADRQADNRHQVRVRQGRNEWLERQMNDWAVWVGAQTQCGLTPAAGLPRLAALRASVTHAAAQIAARMDALSQPLEEAEAAVTQAAAAVGAAEVAVKAATAVFPPCTLKGLVGLLLQFWRWPAWAWFYAFVLPNRCRELATALANLRHATWREANLHTLRQVIHAAQHDLNHLTAQLAAVEQAISSTAAALAQAAAQERLAASPWTEQTLATLWTMHEAEAVPERCHLYLSRRPLATWRLGGVADELAAAMADPEPPLDGWTALDCLVEGLSYAEQAQRTTLEALLRSVPVQEPFAWLDAVGAAATPLWPRPALAQSTSEQRWLLVPTAGGQRAGAPTEPSHYLAKLYWWAETQSDPVQVCWLAGDAVLVLRWLELSVNDLEAEM